MEQLLKSYCKVGQVIYFKVGQSLLQGGVGITKGQVLESGATITEKAIVHLRDARTNEDLCLLANVVF